MPYSLWIYPLAIHYPQERTWYQRHPTLGRDLIKGIPYTPGTREAAERTWYQVHPTPREQINRHLLKYYLPVTLLAVKKKGSRVDYVLSPPPIEDSDRKPRGHSSCTNRANRMSLHALDLWINPYLFRHP